MLILSAALAQLSEDTWCTGATQRNTWLLRRIRFLRRWLVDVNHIRFTQHHVNDSFSATVDNENEDENFLPKSSLSLTTKVAIAILDASASPMLLNSFRICWSHPDGMWERCVGCGCCHGEVQAVRSLFY